MGLHINKYVNILRDMAVCRSIWRYMAVPIFFGLLIPGPKPTSELFREKSSVCYFLLFCHLFSPYPGHTSTTADANTSVWGGGGGGGGGGCVGGGNGGGRGAGDESGAGEW